MFNMSPGHLLIIGIVLLLLFGNRLPDIARSLGRSFNEFKRGLRDVNDEFDKAAGDDRPPQKLSPPRDEQGADPRISRTASGQEPVETRRDERT